MQEENPPPEWHGKCTEIINHKPDPALGSKLWHQEDLQSKRRQHVVEYYHTEGEDAL